MVYAPPRGRPGRFQNEEASAFAERVVYTRRIAKVVKGGRRLRFNALVVVGDGEGQVGAQASLIRKVRPPNAYKEKGIRYAGELLRYKPGKAAARKA